MPKTISWAIAGAIGLWLSWVFQGYILNAAGVGWDTATLGQWGDTFGALNALFATLGFGAALYTLRIQQQQIARDRFDTYFFELFKLLIEARDKVRFLHSQNYGSNKPSQGGSVTFMRSVKAAAAFTGLDAFQHAWLEVRFWAPSQTATTSELVKTYDSRIHGPSEATLGPYFRLLYTILKRISRDRYLSAEDKILYANLVRSQLSRYEIAIIGLNGLSSVSRDFDQLVIDFRLLKYSTGSRRSILMRHYPAKAFEGRS